MWRESVYSGTLRPLTCDQTTANQLDRLLDQLTYSRFVDQASISSRHSINRVDCGLYLGDKYAAKDKKFLVATGITHVLNCAEGTDEYQVNTNQRYYADVAIKYMGIPAHDRPSYNISVYFDLAARFIESAVKSGGNVLVHCVVGISRSATICIAYLMINKGMRAADAMTHIFRSRRVFPNPGFLQHLAQLDNVLMKRRVTYNGSHHSTRPVAASRNTGAAASSLTSMSTIRGLQRPSCVVTRLCGGNGSSGRFF